MLLREAVRNQALHADHAASRTLWEHGSSVEDDQSSIDEEVCALRPAASSGAGQLNSL
jgi:hypothetical protein